MLQYNAEQLRAIESDIGPLLVLSGAGTGKTKVLTTRLANLIFSNRAKNFQILAVTFTNKAANEMKRRVETLIKKPVEGMYIGTFHSIGLRILRKNASYVNLKNDFTILDTDDQLRLLRQILSYLNLDKKKHNPKNYLYFIDSLKLNGFFKGVFLGTKRILRCHPIKTLGGSSGFDPAPKLKKGRK